MTVTIPLYLVTHQRRVGSLYKKWLRALEGNCDKREDYLYRAAFVRCEFDNILNQKDMRKSKQMYLEKMEALSHAFFLPPIHYPSSPEGVAYQREHVCEDWLLDYWHPYEKAVYPEYFKKREIRKLQFIEMWEKKYGPPPPEE